MMSSRARTHTDIYVGKDAGYSDITHTHRSALCSGELQHDSDFEWRAEDSRISLSRSCQRQTLVPLFPPAKRRLQLLWLDNSWSEPLRAGQRDKLTLFTCDTNWSTHLPQNTQAWPLPVLRCAGKTTSIKYNDSDVFT